MERRKNPGTDSGRHEQHIRTFLTNRAGKLFYHEPGNNCRHQHGYEYCSRYEKREQWNTYQFRVIGCHFEFHYTERHVAIGVAELYRSRKGWRYLVELEHCG